MHISPVIATIYANSTAEERKQLAAGLGMSRDRLRGAISEYYAATSPDKAAVLNTKPSQSDQALSFARGAASVKAEIAIGEIAIDPSMRRIIEAINRFPSLCIVECWADDENARYGQRQPGSFYVCILAAPTAQGRDDLEWLLLALHGYSLAHSISYRVDAMPGESVCYRVEGTNGEAPDKLADWLHWAWALSEHGNKQHLLLHCKTCGTELAREVVLYNGDASCHTCLYGISQSDGASVALVESHY